MAKRTGIEKLNKCETFRPVLVTLEPLYLINSHFFREYLDDQLAALNINLPWRILSVDELEKLQPYLAQGLSLNKVLEELENKTFESLLSELHSETGLTFRDSFLYEISYELYRRLGVADRLEIDQNSEDPID